MGAQSDVLGSGSRVDLDKGSSSLPIGRKVPIRPVSGPPMPGLPLIYQVTIGSIVHHEPPGAERRTETGKPGLEVKELVVLSTYPCTQAQHEVSPLLSPG